MKNKEYYNVNEFAEIMGIHRSTVNRYIHRGLIYPIEFGREKLINKNYVDLLNKRDLLGLQRQIEKDKKEGLK